MRKKINSFSRMLGTLLLCAGIITSCYDDSSLWNSINDHESRIAKLETLCNQLNTNITSLQTIVSSLQSNDFVTNISPIMENGKEVGYTITFSQSGSITIYHSKNNVSDSNNDSTLPAIGVKKDTDGIYYWTLNGEWIVDDEGYKIPTTGRNGANGNDGITPQLKIENDYWYISYDNGGSWTQLGRAINEDDSSNKNEDSIFKSITHDERGLVIILLDGTEFIISQTSLLSIEVEDKSAEIGYDEIVSIGYTIKGADETVSISCISEGGFTSEIERIDSISGKIVIISSPDCKNGKVLVIATCNGQTATQMISLAIKGTINLSENGSANCYIVSSSGTYKFTPHKGNSSESISNITSIEVLWESFGTDLAPSKGDLIRNVDYTDGEIIFQTAKEFKEGNAVIAAKDIYNTIIWSWHIWLTDIPDDQVYYNDAGTFMDRNLGSVSSEPGDVGALGLLYQWGRKDPFLNASDINVTDRAKSTLDSWPSPIWSDEDRGTIEYAIENPTTFIKCNSKNYDWCYTGSSYVDITRWSKSYNSKTIYDPCPSGYRIPSGNELYTACNYNYTFTTEFDHTNRGINFTNVFGDDERIWYPAAGQISFQTLDGMSTTGNWGNYWTAQLDKHWWNENTYTYYGNYVELSSAGNVRTEEQLYLSYALSVRCIKE